MVNLINDSTIGKVSFASGVILRFGGIRETRRIFVFLLLFSGGCMSQQALDVRIKDIEQKHAVTIKAGNALSRCGFFGDLTGLLERIDTDLEKCPDYFKRHLGPIVIEESFADNIKTYPFSLLLRGYVDTEESGWPIHIKNRSLLEKVLLWAPRDDDLFLHEASHSFEFNMGTNFYEEWLAFYEAFSGPKESYGGIVASLVSLAVPPISYLRPVGMPTFYGSVNHFEDFAETHCYLRRHKDIEPLKSKDLQLYEKCKAAEKFIHGSYGKKHISTLDIQ